MLFFYAFIAGFIIPFMATRMGKILPATTGEILFKLWHRPHFPRIHNPIMTTKLKYKWVCLLLTAIGLGIIYTGMTYLSSIYYPETVFIYANIFNWLILVLMMTDFYHMLLPDCFTIPLLCLAFLFAVDTNAITPMESLYGVGFAYVITTLSVFLLSFRKQNFFGGGDSKMALAIGAWLGIQGLNYTLLMSFFLFGIYLCIRRNKSGAYGPALGLAALFNFFIIYSNI